MLKFPLLCTLLFITSGVHAMNTKEACARIATLEASHDSQGLRLLAQQLQREEAAKQQQGQDTSTTAVAAKRKATQLEAKERRTHVQAGAACKRKLRF